MWRAVLALGVGGVATGCVRSEASSPTTTVQVGELAPDFALSDLNGATHRLSDYTGKVRVLEWFNPGCPYVKYAHGDGPLKAQAARVTAEGTVWLAINSGAPGKQGHGIETNKAAVGEWSMNHPVLIDEDGTVGRQYGAKTTPQMYVIDESGKIVYQGALDNNPLGRSAGKTKNFVDLALASVAAKKPVETSSTKPYGCSVKYGDG